MDIISIWSVYSTAIKMKIVNPRVRPLLTYLFECISIFHVTQIRVVHRLIHTEHDHNSIGCFAMEVGAVSAKTVRLEKSVKRFFKVFVSHVLFLLSKAPKTIHILFRIRRDIVEAVLFPDAILLDCWVLTHI